MGGWIRRVAAGALSAVRGGSGTMRITGGILGGRRIAVPRTSLRPTQDRIRGAVFSSIGDGIEGARVLDLFAGSGAMGLEAFSRGACFVCWVESDIRACRTISENVRSLCSDPDRARVVRSDAIRFISRYDSRVTEPFDVVFSDPPYDHGGVWLKKILFALSRGSILKNKGLLVMEQDANAPIVEEGGWMLLRNKAYGGTRVCFFVKTTTEFIA